MVYDITMNGTEYKAFAYLQCVSLKESHNKYYEAYLHKNGLIETYHGKEGVTRVRHDYQPGEKNFDALIRSKTREKEPYKDITFTKVEMTKNDNGIDVAKGQETKLTGDKVVDGFLDFLKECREKTIKNNYKTGFQASSVTKKLVDDLRSFIEDLAIAMKNDDKDAFNETLENIFTIAPRKSLYSVGQMYRGSDKVITMEKAYEFESNLYETLYNQYEANKLQQIQQGDTNKKTLPEAMGVNIREITYAEEDEINKALKFAKDMSHCYISAIRVDNPTTAKAYSETREKRGIKDKDCKLLFHGSNNSNWLSLVKNGMILNADALGVAARGTGKGLGNGIYYADDIEKSLNYVFDSYSTSRTADDGIKCIGLYEVAVGRVLEVPTYDSSLSHYTMEKKHYDTSFINGKKYKATHYSGHSGRNEYCVYDVGQTNIKYILMCQKEQVRQNDMHFSVRLDIPYADMRKDGDLLIADAKLSSKAKTELGKLTNNGVCETAKGIFNLKEKNFNFEIDGNIVTLTPTEEKKLFHDFKKSYFLSEKDFENYIQDPEKDGRLMDNDLYLDR